MPRHVLESALAALIVAAQRAPLTYTASAPAAAHLAIGHALLTAQSESTVWAVTDLQLGRTQRDWQSHVLRAPGTRQAIAAVWWVPSEAPLPCSADDWGAWRQAAVPLTPALRAMETAPLLMLALNAQGQVAGIVHDGVRWEPLARVRLPGAGMRVIELHGRRHATQELRIDDAANGRYSRLAGALRSDVLHRMQHSVFGLVGCGRVGTSVAATLVRYGASVLLIDPDHAELHNIGDGDMMLPVHEGLPKVDALARGLRPLLRPGAWIDARRLSVDSSIAGRLLAGTDLVISAVDNDATRLWAAAWCAVLMLPQLDIGVAVPLQGTLGADIRLTLPGIGCLACVGGFAGGGTVLLNQLDRPLSAPGADFRQQRRGSLRSVGVSAAQLGVRLIEQLYEGRAAGCRFVQLSEDEASGTLRLADAAVQRPRACPVCRRLSGQGVGAVGASAVRLLARRLADPSAPWSLAPQA